MKAFIKDVGMAIAPRATMEALSARSQKLIMQLEKADGRVAASNRFVTEHGATVSVGPFKGMTYPAQTVIERNLINKLLGTYEDQLYPWVEEAIAHEPRKIINIGSADGYYAVGLAMRCPNAQTIAFDTDKWARNATSALAKENNVQNLEVKSYCTSKWLELNVLERTLLLVDCEGNEEFLMDIKLVPNLTKASIIVELHEHVVPGLEEIITARFSETHSIASVGDRNRNIDDISQLAFLDSEMRKRVISEGRSWPQTWLYLEPKSQNTN